MEKKTIVVASSNNWKLKKMEIKWNYIKLVFVF